MRATVLLLCLSLLAPAAGHAQYAQALGAAKATARKASGVAARTDQANPAAATEQPKPVPASVPKAAPDGRVAKPETAPGAAAPAGSQQAQAAETSGFTYQPEGRRDPFVSLLRRGTTGPRPAGLKGLGTGEVTLKGTLASQGEWVALLQGADTKTYVVHSGEELFDGTVQAITKNALVILQRVNDPLSTETHREVRKVLRQTDEAR